jgi:uncharacterized protein YchJ
MKMMSPEPNMRIVVGTTGHAYNSYADRIVIEDVLPEDRSDLVKHGYTEYVIQTPGYIGNGVIPDVEEHEEQ